ncbi:unnamed protein product, partial [Ectocarpus fasciculatus]
GGLARSLGRVENDRHDRTSSKPQDDRVDRVLAMLEEHTHTKACRRKKTLGKFFKSEVEAARAEARAEAAAEALAESLAEERAEVGWGGGRLASPPSGGSDGQ